MTIPKLCRQRSRKGDRAFVTDAGRRVYLGEWGAASTEDAYREFILKKARPDLYLLDDEPPEGATVAEVAVTFFEARANYYVKGGRQTGQLDRFKYALEYVVEFYGNERADDFGPRKLLKVREAMETSGRFSRKYINTLLNCIRHVWRFAVERELVTPETLTALQCVEGLKRGRTFARELAPVAPVDPATVEATKEQLPPIIAAMVDVQRLTGMRPGEVCAMRVRDVTLLADGCALYTLATDKTDWRRDPGVKKRIPLGPKATAILTPYIMEKEDDPDAYLFSPRDVMRDAAYEKRRQRKSPLTPSQRARDQREPRREYGERYETTAYARAISRAAERAGVPHWAPNQLRHLYATEIRAKYGLEASQIMLGHANANVTQIYAERDFAKMVEVAKAEG